MESFGEGFSFTWNYDSQDPNGSPYDRTMLLVYFPGITQPRFFQMIGGAERSACEEFLEASAEMKEKYAETYISFIKSDHSAVSDSVYIGRVEF